MQNRGFIQFLLLLLASGCLAFDMTLTLTLLLICVGLVEIVAWTHILDNQENDLQKS